VLQCVAVRCSVLRVAYVAVCCSVLQCDAVAECCSEQITRIHASSYREGRGAKACRDSRFISPLTQFLKCQFCSRFAQQTSQHADFWEFLSGKVRCASTQCGEILKSLVATKCTVCNDCKSDFWESLAGRVWCADIVSEGRAMMTRPRMYMCMCIYVYMYICMYVYMYICIYVYMYICIYVYMYICICICICICVYMHICIYVCKYLAHWWRGLVYICIYVYMYVSISRTDDEASYIYAYMYICM